MPFCITRHAIACPTKLNEEGGTIRAVGITLLIGSALTLAWFFLCPTYVVRGDTATIENYFNGVGIAGRERNHLDAATFFAVDVVIWTTLAGVFCLRHFLFDLFFGVRAHVPADNA